MGVSYTNIEHYLKNKKLDPVIFKKIQNLKKLTEHKRNPVPHPKPMDDSFLD